MQLIRGLSAIKKRHKGCVLTIGNFDGVHKGHQNILAEVRRQAAAHDTASAAMVFEPLPREYFCVQSDLPSRLQTFREKLETLDDLGLDQLVCLHFNRDLRGLTAEEFIQQVLVEGLNIRHLIVGDDFRFGLGRSGTYSTLEEAGQQYGFTVANTHSVILDNERISSTLIRNCLKEGEFARAEHFLGRPFLISGRVLHGQKLGRTLGVPTANLRLGRRHSPVRGVYAVQVKGEQLDKVYQGVANIGSRPTVEGGFDRLEVHLLDFDGDLYGRRIQVEFVGKIRDEQKFENLDALKAAIHRDIAGVRAILTDQ